MNTIAPVRHDLSITGMTCASCVRRVERALSAVEGVETASVNLVTERATVVHDPTVAPLDALERAVREAGYEVAAQAPASRAAPALQRAGERERAEEQEQQTFRRDLAVSVALTAPLLVLAMSHGAIPGSEQLWIQLVLATPVVFGPGWRFFRLGWASVRHGSPDMSALVALGSGAAWLYSAAVVLVPGLQGSHAEHGSMPAVYFEAAAAIITFVLIGKWLESRAKKKLSDSVRAMIALQPSSAARLLDDGSEIAVPVEEIAEGFRILVRPGERAPADGEIVQGSSSADESMLTGESMPVDKGPGDKVFAGTINGAGAIVLRATATGQETALARIIEAVEQAQGSKAPIAQLADVISAWFVPAVLAAAALTGIAWYALDPIGGGLAAAVQQAVAVLVIACPCALGLATPAAVAAGTARGAELGILVKGGAPLEAASQIDTVLLDKTGTLTTGSPELTDVIAVDGDRDALLRLVAAAERPSEHPVAKAIVAAWSGELPEATDFRSQAGAGAEARVGGHQVRIGTRAWIEQEGIDAGALEADAERLARAGRTPSLVSVDGRLAGLVAVADRPTSDAPAAVAALKGLGIRVVMVSGDRRSTAEAIASELGIEHVYAEVRPEQKAAIVREHQQAGRRVAMVGDGINDAPALATADVGVAIGAGADAAVAAADIALMGRGIGALPRALSLSRATLRTIRQNLFWAFAYNAIGIPVAAGALFPWTGLLLTPAIASAAMSLSSISVLVSSLRLRRFAR